MTIQTNKELELAFNFVENTSRNIFLTGKAGTGKTTFLLNLKLKSPKRMIVLAPTGVAAINAQGVTIHSFFQLPFGPYIVPSNNSQETTDDLFMPPKNDNAAVGQRFNRLAKDKLDIIKTLDLLVIDEISMVRADLLDAVSDALCKYRKNNKPFGGVQLLMIGDVQQLSPVVKEDEWNLLKEQYQSPFFFSSKALKQSNFISIELENVYRQQDGEFLKLLNSIRDGVADSVVLTKLNKRYIPNFNPTSEEGYVTLCTHNRSAQKINTLKLNDLETKAFFFEADITGDFPDYMYPTDKTLELKIDAQVMFVQNDPTPNKSYYNGKIGKVKGIFNDFILVESDDQDIIVTKGEWTNAKYTIDPQTKEIIEKIEGIFKQYPLKCAWAITIHKSQGLTFEKVIIDAENSFAHGQVYVALSRCKTLEGIVLKTPLLRSSIIRNDLLYDFCNYVRENLPSDNILNSSIKEFYCATLLEFFSYDSFKWKFNSVFKLLNINLSSIYPKLIETWKDAKEKTYIQLYEVGDKFAKQLSAIINKSTDYSNDNVLNDRIEKGIIYFKSKIEEFINPLLKDTLPMPDNKDAKKQLNLALERLLEEFRIKVSALEKFSNNKFDVALYLKLKSEAILSGQNSKIKNKKSKTTLLADLNADTDANKEETTVHTDILNEEIFNRLLEFRLSESKEKNLPAYIVLLQKTIVEIANTQPKNIDDLLKINGIGKKKAEMYGSKILDIVASCNKIE